MKSILSKNWRKRYCFSKLRKVKVFHLKIPKATVLDIKTQKVLTKDSVTVSVDAVVYYRCYCNIHRHHHRQHLHHPHHRHHHYHPHILVSMLLSPDQVFSEIGSQLINTMVTHFSDQKTWMAFSFWIVSSYGFALNPFKHIMILYDDYTQLRMIITILPRVSNATVSVANVENAHHSTR